MGFFLLPHGLQEHIIERGLLMDMARKTTPPFASASHRCGRDSRPFSAVNEISSPVCPMYDTPSTGRGVYCPSICIVMMSFISSALSSAGDPSAAIFPRLMIPTRSQNWSASSM
jgi:hypothetical protein